MAEVEDGELMLRYARGDMRAFETLYRRHRSALYRYLARHTRDPEVANDLFQEVWSKVIASRERYEPRAKFSTFLYRIAHNCFIDHCRRAPHGRIARTSATRTFDLEKLLPAPLQIFPTRAPSMRRRSTRYRSALAALPAEQRDRFCLRGIRPVARGDRHHHRRQHGDSEEPPALRAEQTARMRWARIEKAAGRAERRWRSRDMTGRARPEFEAFLHAARRCIGGLRTSTMPSRPRSSIGSC